MSISADTTWEVVKTIAWPSKPCTGGWDCLSKLGQWTFFSIAVGAQSLAPGSTVNPVKQVAMVITSLVTSALYAPYLFFMPQRIIGNAKSLTSSFKELPWLVTSTPTPTSEMLHRGDLRGYQRAFDTNERLFWDQGAKHLSWNEARTFKSISQQVSVTEMSQWLRHGATNSNIVNFQQALENAGVWGASDPNLAATLLAKASSSETKAIQAYLNERRRIEPGLLEAQHAAGVDSGLWGSDPTRSLLSTKRWNALSGLWNPLTSTMQTGLMAIAGISSLISRKYPSEDRFAQSFFGKTMEDAQEFCATQPISDITENLGLFQKPAQWGSYAVGGFTKYFTPIIFGQQILGDYTMGGWKRLATSLHNYLFIVARHDLNVDPQYKMIPTEATSWIGGYAQSAGIFSANEAADAGLKVLMAPFLAYSIYKVAKGLLSLEKEPNAPKDLLGRMMQILDTYIRSWSLWQFDLIGNTLRHSYGLAQNSAAQGWKCAMLNNYSAAHAPMKFRRPPKS